ncbi:MATE family efflux transporter [Photobacterium minamisatsumaniensis]|uniref:MATE family efflux transporter n=1 Tax=Photobacterium minamisatsumaniensis TaxID=2910233 RepID=UPI003D0A7C21
MTYNNTSLIRLLLESKALLRLSIPIIITQLATQGMGFVDTTMAGQVSPSDLAAIALGTSLWVPANLLLRGVLMALTPITAFHRGSGDKDKISSELFQMAWIALFGSLILIVYLNFGGAILSFVNVSAEVIPIASNYLIALAFGVPGIALFYTLNSFCEGMNNTKAPMFFSLLGLAINIPINYILIYGKFGMPALGAVGSGWATSIVYWAMSILLFLYIRRHHHYKNIIDYSHFAPHFSPIVKLVKLGLPIGINIAVCGSIFSVIALLIGRLGTTNIASAQIALNISSMTYMIPMSLSFGITVRVGHALGKNDELTAKFRSKIGIAIAALLSMISAAFFILFPEWITRLYTTDPIISATASSLLFYTAIYQISDALQTSSNGALRAYKDTKIPMFLACTAYWGIALPLGITLGMTNYIVPAMGETGFWIGIIAGLSLSALLMLLRLTQVVKRRESPDTMLCAAAT